MENDLILNMKYIVYITVNVINNKIYVGVHNTENPEIFDGYLGCGVNINTPSSYKNSKTPFQFAVNKYGINSFKRIVLYVFNSKEEAYNKEVEIVTQEFINRKDVYNSKLGGIGGGVTKSVYQYSLKGNFIREFISLKDASDKYNITPTSIYNAIKDKAVCKNFLWDYNYYLNLDISNYITKTNIKNIYKFDTNNNLIETYKSIIDAAKNNNTNSSNLGRAIKGKYSVNGFKFSDSPVYINFKKEKNCPIYAYDLYGNFVKKFDSIIDIQKELNLKRSGQILSSIRLERKCGNYQLSYDFLPCMKKLVSSTAPKRVGQFTLDFTLIKEYDTVGNAIKDFGTAVQKVLKGQREQCKGYIFKYIS